MDNILIFPAIVTKLADDDFNVRFPDFEEINTFGSTFEDAFICAEDALSFCVYEKTTDKEAMPSPTKINSLLLEHDQQIIVLKINLVEILKKYNTSSVKKTLTIPSWLNNLAENNGINFSQLLQLALKETLHID